MWRCWRERFRHGAPHNSIPWRHCGRVSWSGFFTDTRTSGPKLRASSPSTWSVVTGVARPCIACVADRRVDDCDYRASSTLPHSKRNGRNPGVVSGNPNVMVWITRVATGTPSCLPAVYLLRSMTSMADRLRAGSADSRIVMDSGNTSPEREITNCRRTPPWHLRRRSSFGNLGGGPSTRVGGVSRSRAWKMLSAAAAEAGMTSPAVIPPA